MNTTKLALLALGVWLSCQTAAFADATHATCDEAKAMAEKAVAYYKANGAEKSWATFMAKDPAFFDRDLYVFAFDTSGIYKVHATKPIMVGKNGLEMKDANGKSFVKEIIAVKDADWVEYVYMNPVDNNKFEPKKSYITHVDDYLIGVGCYIL